MSYGAFATPFKLGLRHERTGPALAGIPGPAETPARVADFTTRRLAGMGTFVQEPPRPEGFTFLMYQPPTSSQQSPTPGTPVAVANSPTPVAYPWQKGICPAFGCNVSPVEVPRGIEIAQEMFPSSSTQTTPTPTTTATPTPATGVALTSGAAATAQAGTPVPVGYPTSQAYVDSGGNIWTYTTTGGWQLTGNTATSAPLQNSSGVVPPNYPTNQPYTDSAGNVWTYSATAGWQITVPASSTAASSTAPSVNVSTTTADWVASLTNWLQQQTIWSGIPNFWIAAGVGVGALMLWPKGRR